MEASAQPPRIEATVRRVSRLSPRVLGLVIAAPPEFTWHAGQHLSLSGVPVGGETGYYSIASAPRATAPGELELAVIEDSLPVAERVRSGSPVYLGQVGGAFPLGRLLNARNVALVGMGTGVAPLRAAVQELLSSTERNEAQHVTLIHGARTEIECFYREEFEALAGERFTYRPVISRPSSGFSGLSGRVQHHLGELPIDDVEYCLCGSRLMVHEVRDLLLARGVRSESIYGEGY